jgi:hypothetical protein
MVETAVFLVVCIFVFIRYCIKEFRSPMTSPSPTLSQREMVNRVMRPADPARVEMEM